MSYFEVNSTFSTGFRVSSKKTMFTVLTRFPVNYPFVSKMHNNVISYRFTEVVMKSKMKMKNKLS